MDKLEIAQTIQNQLISTLGKPVIWSWGQEDVKGLSAAEVKKLGIENSIGALQFKVNAHRHDGYVIVSLNGIDTYDVFICDRTKNTIIIKEQKLGLYFDEFGKWIDEVIEKIPEYSY